MAAAPRLTRRICGLVAMLTLATLARVVAAAPVTLGEFDGLKKSVTLPNGQRIAFVELGDPSGRPVVLIHGIFDSSRAWLPVVPYLSTHDRLILVDSRGHGQSAKPECCYALIDFAYDIKLLMDSLQLSRADLVGHSLGSFITQTFAEQWPERTRRIVLLSSSGGERPCVAHKKPAVTVADMIAEIKKLKEPIDPDSPFMMNWFASPAPLDPEFLRRERRDAAGIPLAVWLAIATQATPTIAVQNPALRRLTMPALLLWGSADPFFGTEARHTLRTALPHAEVKVYQGLGHNFFQQDPESTGQAINSFLDRGS